MKSTQIRKIRIFETPTLLYNRAKNYLDLYILTYIVFFNSIKSTSFVCYIVSQSYPILTNCLIGPKKNWTKT